MPPARSRADVRSQREKEKVSQSSLRRGGFLSAPFVGFDGKGLFVVLAAAWHGHRAPICRYANGMYIQWTLGWLEGPLGSALQQLANSYNELLE